MGFSESLTNILQVTKSFSKWMCSVLEKHVLQKPKCPLEAHTVEIKSCKVTDPIS